MPSLRLCTICSRLYGDAGCPEHGTPESRRKLSHQQRSNLRNREQGRTTRHWQRLRRAVIARDGACLDCGTTTDLTVDLLRADKRHDLAELEECVTRCRRCHGRKDGRRAHPKGGVLR